MKSPVIIIGIGEMGSVFARGLLRAGHPVYPATRETDLAELARQLPAPELVLIAVAEKDLHTTLEQIPASWQSRIALLQNELLPADWKAYGFIQPTVISVWFEKKKGQDVKVLIPSPAFGPAAGLLQESLGMIDIPVRTLASADELLIELVIKNVYIVTTNCAGLLTGGTVSELWANHRELAEGIAREVIQIQESLVGHDAARRRTDQGHARGLCRRSRSRLHGPQRSGTAGARPATGRCQRPGSPATQKDCRARGVRELTLAPAKRRILYNL